MQPLTVDPKDLLKANDRRKASANGNMSNESPDLRQLTSFSSDSASQEETDMKLPGSKQS